MHINEPILITGLSGAGKNFSLIGLPFKETFIMRATAKAPLPIANHNKFYQEDTEKTPGNTLMVTQPIFFEDGEWKPKFNNLLQYTISRGFKYFVIDDVQFLLTGIENMFKQSGEYKESRKIYQVIKMYATAIISAAQATADKIQTIFIWQKLPNQDKLLVPGTQFTDEIVPQGYFNIVLEAAITLAGARVFKVNGAGTCKTPWGLFQEDTIPNDITLVLNRLKEFEDGIDCPMPPMYSTVKEQEEAIKKAKAAKLSPTTVPVSNTVR